ncbi:flagellar biosynthesis anti-sigma factor FlgM [Clostridium sp. 'White wine YQ']|uniref:flagellar biosynthesis anti-sigma factor FlgM n=1 Tax=Clostridium sp. 'White wine YQ' TaxID=3027474 RepID=UPI0023663EA7|nr:flagellar biosynthesis anti-sigma factor FlgM [Clostridium sp. 'White wine YQ']MDD7794635.1 flagellar biosynthesis anti-sigma factor FlgM [Clostridium sp. 'White wine YQ']
MNIKGISPSSINNYYNSNVKKVEKKDVAKVQDKIEISKTGKALQKYGVDEVFTNSPEKIEKLKNDIKNGTYNPSSAAISKAMFDSMKGRKI